MIKFGLFTSAGDLGELKGYEFTPSLTTEQILSLYVDAFF